MTSEQHKSQILRKAPQIRKSANETYKKVFITPDLSPMERERDRKLRQEKKRREENGEQGLVMRNGKIVRRATGDASGERVNPDPAQNPPEEKLRLLPTLVVYTLIHTNPHRWRKHEHVLWTKSTCWLNVTTQMHRA